MAIRALARMYRPAEELFVHCIRRTKNGDLPEGVSRRYTAIALIGLATEPPETARTVLAGQDPMDVLGRLLRDSRDSQDLGEVALTLWAARMFNHPAASMALDRLKAMDPVAGQWPTVETAWSLTALVYEKPTEGLPGGDSSMSLHDRPKPTEGFPWGDLAGQIANRLLASVNPRSNLFSHWPAGSRSPWLRRHVTCFADAVYPIQALSHCYLATGRPAALTAALRCANQICSLQGPAGQWWWHYDCRTGRIIEKYPVYSVHQDGMGPMALLAALRAMAAAQGRACESGMVCDTQCPALMAAIPPAIDRSLAWMVHSPEIAASLIDPQAGLIWRKVARHEPGKLVRQAQALASRLHPRLRLPGLGPVFRPTWVDLESRPYHMGWILHAFPGG